MNLYLNIRVFSVRLDQIDGERGKKILNYTKKISNFRKSSRIPAVVANRWNLTCLILRRLYALNSLLLVYRLFVDSVHSQKIDFGSLNDNFQIILSNQFQNHCEKNAFSSGKHWDKIDRFFSLNFDLKLFFLHCF